MIRTKKPADIKLMRQSGQILATVLKVTSQAIVPGITTQALAAIAAREVRQLGGEAAFLGFGGFPDVICISINDVVVHGIPDARVIQNGDIVSLDFGVNYQGMITDSARSYVVGKLDESRQRLMRGTQQSLDAGLAVLKDGVRVGDIGAAIQAVLEAHRLGIVRNLVGHGVGYNLHEDPDIPNFGRVGSGLTLKSGTTIAIEPMATLGTDDVYMADDNWAILTKDGSLSAHFEDTVLITEHGYEILTRL